MLRAVDGPLQLREERFHGIGPAAVLRDVFAAAMIDRFVRTCFFADVFVGMRLVGVTADVRRAGGHALRPRGQNLGA